MLLGFGESLEDVVGLLVVFLHHSLLCVFALFLNPFFLYCLHHFAGFSAHFSVSLERLTRHDDTQKFSALLFCVFIQFYSALTQLKVICKCTWLSCDSVHGFNVEIW